MAWSKGIFLEFPFFAENMIIRSILNLWWHSEILKLILGVVRGMFTETIVTEELKTVKQKSCVIIT